MSKKEAQIDYTDEILDAPEPSEEDIFLHDTGPLGSKTSVFANNNFVGEFKTIEETEQAIKNWMEENQYYPNIWYVDDHGGINPYTLED